MAKLIVAQHDLSAETLTQLHAAGVVDGVTLLRLDFAYQAPDRSAADQLAAFLREDTDYDIEVVRGPLQGFRRGWLVSGRTQQTPVFTELLEDWIRWMVYAGAKYGECRFDGWGALVPV